MNAPMDKTTNTLTNAIGRFLRRVAMVFGRNRFRSELEEEMAFHRAEKEKALVAAGSTAVEARYAVLREFGNAARLSEKSHEVVAFRVETVGQDMRFALRQLRRSPGFGLTAIFILALGMGVSVAIFGFVDAALIQPLPYAQPNRLMDVAENARAWPRSNLSFQDYLDYKRLNKSFASLDVYTGMGYLLQTPSGVEPVNGARVSDGFFSTLGVKPMLGRGFLPGEDQAGKPKIAILTYGTWIKRFGGNGNIVGQAVNLSGEAYTLVGVLPREFAFAPRGEAEFWVPMLELEHCEQHRTCHNLFGVGRLRDGVTPQAALSDMQAIAKRLEAEYPGSNRDQGATVQPLSELILHDIRPVLELLLAGAGLLLLIACINVASLLLVRSESRRREIAVRGALGATPVRLTRQFITEGLLLAVAGCAGGVFVAAWLMTLLTRLVPKAMADGLPFLAAVGLNRDTALFAAVVALGAALLLAATPTLRLSLQPIRHGLYEGGAGTGSTLWRRMGANLVVVELAVAMVLLVGAGLLGQSFYRLLHVELGFDPGHLATVDLLVPANIYPKDEQQVAVFREIVDKMASQPGVVSVGLTSALPVHCNCDTDWIRVVGKPYNGEHNEINEREVSPGYLATLRAQLVRGHMLTDDDRAGKPHVIVINEGLARKYFPGEDPIGKTIGDGGLSPDSLRQVVGVVRDVRESGLDTEVWPTEYEPLYQNADIFATLVVRTQEDPDAFLPTMVKTLRAINPNLGVSDEETMEQQIGETQSALLHRFSAWLVGGFAAIALILGVVGLYGVVAYSVSRRTREIGVRMALGAQRGTVYALVLGQAGRLTVVGVGFGLACSFGTSLLMEKMLFGIKAWDAGTLAGVALLLGCAAMAASFLPAHRAASVNPTEALRAE
jgi:macrolide transport system ATP-binding/permease protein